jgi:hypothetical protein
MTDSKCAGRIVVHFKGNKNSCKNQLSLIYDFITQNIDWSKCPVPVTDVSKGYVTFEKPYEQPSDQPEAAPTEE